MKVKLLSCVQLLATPWTTAYLAPLSMGFFQARALEWGAIAFSNGSVIGFNYDEERDEDMLTDVKEATKMEHPIS